MRAHAARRGLRIREARLGDFAEEGHRQVNIFSACDSAARRFGRFICPARKPLGELGLRPDGEEQSQAKYLSRAAR